MEKKAKEEEERKARERGDNARERALVDMMGGVLEIKKEDELKKVIAFSFHFGFQANITVFTMNTSSDRTFLFMFIVHQDGLLQDFWQSVQILIRLRISIYSRLLSQMHLMFLKTCIYTQ